VVFSGPGTAVITARSGASTATVSLTALQREFIGGASGSISSGMDATCGLLPLGKTFCFGVAPVIGIAKDTTCFGDIPEGDPRACTLIPLQIANNLQLSSLAVGDSVACGLDPQNRAFCWGDQSYGQVGNGISKAGTPSLPVPVRGPLGQAETFTKITAGHAHACGLNTAGIAYCWGLDSAYQLGGSDRIVANSSTPIPVHPSMAFTAIAAGRNHTCGVRSGDGAAVCWGNNLYGQLGRGTAGDSSDVPTPVVGNVAFTRISTLRDFTCALSTVGTIYCWGDNRSGRWAATTADSVPTPMQIPGTGYTSVSVGWNHACALNAAGGAVCWGSNAFAQLGNNVLSGGNSSTPITVAGALTFSAISTGSRTTCGLTATGAYCWGSTLYGAAGGQLQALKIGAPAKTATPQ
jgi:alpha-tubulin suppressor-like RCC1 family protein